MEGGLNQHYPQESKIETGKIPSPRGPGVKDSVKNSGRVEIWLADLSAVPTRVVSGSDISRLRLIGSGIFRLLYIRRLRITLATWRKRRGRAFEINPIVEPLTVFGFSSKDTVGTSGIRKELEGHLATLFGFRAELAVG